MHNSLKYFDSQKGKRCDVPTCMNNADRHHMSEVGMGRNRKKPMMEHFLVSLLCRAHHVEWDQIGEKRFVEKYNVNLWKHAAQDLAKWVWSELCEAE